MDTKKVLIIGATGLLGKPVTDSLNQKGLKVSILARDVEKSRTVLGENYEYEEGDVMNAASLEKAMKACYGAHINLNGDIERQGTVAVVEAAKKTGVQRISYISGASVCSENTWFPMIAGKFAAENCIKESGISYCIFKPSWFMDSMARFVTGTKAMMIGKQPNPWHFVAACDYGRMVANSYLSEEAADKSFFIYGPEPMTMHQALRKYINVLYPEIDKINDFSFGFLKAMAFFTGKKRLKDTVAMMKYFESARELDGPQEANRILGAPEYTFDKWLEEKKGKSVQA